MSLIKMTLKPIPQPFFKTNSFHAHFYIKVNLLHLYFQIDYLLIVVGESCGCFFKISSYISDISISGSPPKRLTLFSLALTSA